MELPDRDRRENELAALLFALFDDQRGRVERYRLSAEWNSFTSDVSAAIAEKTSETFAAAALAFILFANERTGRALASPAFGAIAEQWGASHGRVVAGSIAEKSRFAINQAIRDPDPEALIRQLDVEFSRTRADAVAITETTNAISLGESAGRSRVETSGVANFVRIWWTEDDARVCPICRPLHMTSERVWERQFRSGPPAHPRCRCWLIYEVISRFPSESQN